MKFKVALTSLFFSVLAASSAYAQIPVTDVASIAQQIQVVANTVKQLTTLGQQLNTMNQQLEAVKGARGMGGLNRNENYNYLPANYDQINNLATNGSGQYSALANRVQQILGDNAVLTDADMANLSPDMRATLIKTRNHAATQSAISRSSYENASNRTQNLQNLVNQIDSASDSKAIADLQARISWEQAAIQNDAIKLAQATQLSAADKNLQDQRMIEQLIQMRGSSSLKNSSFKLTPNNNRN